MALWSTPAEGLEQGVGEESAFMQPSGGRPDHKAFWVKKQLPKKCGAMVPLDLFTPQRAKVVFFSALCGFQGPVSSYVDMAGCNISDKSSQITPQAFSASTSAFIHISINQFTTCQCMALYSYSITQSTLTRLCPLSYRNKTTPHSCAITTYSSNLPTAKILTSHYSLVFFSKRFHIYAIFPSNFSSDICLC